MTEKEKVVMFCPNCLKKMVNGSNPKIYFHLVPNKKCPVATIHLNENHEIAEIVRSEYNERISFKP